MMSYSGFAEEFKKIVERGVRARGIADISCKDAPCAGIKPVEPVQELLDWGVDIRYLDHYHGLSFAVLDRKICTSVISGDVPGVSLSNPTTAPLNVLWTDDRVYAQSLTHTFELLWAQSVPAAQRIKELLEERRRSLGG